MLMLPGLLARYVAARYWAALLLFGSGLTGLAIAGDLAFRAKDLIQSAQGPFLEFLLRYYAYKSPYLLTLTLPPTILFAAVFTLVRLSRTNELLPMMVAGVSLRRVSLPFLSTAALFTLVMAAVHWALLPATWRTLEMMEDLVRGDRVGEKVVALDRAGNQVSAAIFDRGERVLTGVFAVLADPDGGAAREILCERAVCERWRERSDTARWRFFSGTVYELEGGVRKVVADPDGGLRQVSLPIPPEGTAAQIGVTPIDLLRKSYFGEHLSLTESMRAIRRDPTEPRHRMQLYLKLTDPLAPLLLMLLGLPLALRSTFSRDAFAGIGLCLIVVLGFYALQQLFAQLGHQGSLPPIAATVAPALALGALGAVLFARVRT